MIKFSLEDLYKAYFDARKNKRSTINALNFEIDFERKIQRLYEDLLSGQYQIGRSICFVIFYPVQREILASGFRDRVVHHLIYNYLNPLCERRFIKDSYACRKNKGPHFGIKRADYFIRSCSANYTQPCHILKLDIKSYFMSIDRFLLYKKVCSLVESGDFSYETKKFLLNTLKKIIFHNYVDNCFRKGGLAKWQRLPKDKSLFNAPAGKGLPIGNLTSQLFGNLYLNDFDHFIKSSFPGIFYARYMDDMIFVHQDKDFLFKLIPVLKNYLVKNLLINIHDKKIYCQSMDKGINFLGCVIKPHRLYLRTRVKTNLYRKIRTLDLNSLDSFMQKRKNLSLINSYLGTISHYNTFKLRQKVCSAIGEGFSGRVFFNDNYTKMLGYF
ncbi:MAG: reverse transcriptase domain-containing protein [Patescibacteria group bacterium]|nr:MAG: reverse transcriptase domain-containing protein [Patescibacteria group bacterium]